MTQRQDPATSTSRSPSDGKSKPATAAPVGAALTDTRLDGIFFLLGGIAAVWRSYLLFRESFALGWGQLWFSFI